MKTSKKILAANVARMMEAHGYKNSSALAKRIKTGHSQVDRILEGTIATSIDTLDRLADAFGVAAWELLTDTEDTRKRAIERLLGPNLTISKPK